MMTASEDTFDFDHVPDRRHTNSLKFDFAEQRGYPADVLPLWVADMDFPTAPPIREALKEAAEFGIFGYSDVGRSYCKTVTDWFSDHFAWEARESWMVKTPGVVYALAQAVRAFTDVGDAVIVQPPVYYPFFSVVEGNGRRVVENPLLYREGRYSIDFDDLERKIIESEAKLFLLCSPHNPTGRVWTSEELRELGKICRAHDVIVVSDEIHCDFVWPGHEHHVFCDAVPEMLEQTIVCTAPSKTFNLAGLQISHIFIPGMELRHRFKAEMERSGYSQANTMGLIASQAAYSKGLPWLEACRSYLLDNLRFVEDYVLTQLSPLRMTMPEGTYFAWIDCSGLGLSSKELDDLVIGKARLWLDAGHIFGDNGDQFQRIVTACPRSLLAQALERLRDAIDEL